MPDSILMYRGPFGDVRVVPGKSDIHHETELVNECARIHAKAGGKNANGVTVTVARDLFDDMTRESDCALLAAARKAELDDKLDELSDDGYEVVTFPFKIGAVVNVIPLGLPGIVTGLMRSLEGDEIRVVYWAESARRAEWLTPRELGPMPEGASSKDPLAPGSAKR